MQNDTLEPLNQIRKRLGQPLGIEMGKISTDGKLRMDSLRTRFLELYQTKNPGNGDPGIKFKLKNDNVQNGNPYVAVSCPWSLPAGVDASTGGYEITTNIKHKTFTPPDIVISRVIKFLNSEGIRRCWIDKLCVDQTEGSAEKEIAIQSMHLVYFHSEWTLGLLFVSLKQKKQLELLRELLDGRLVSEKWDLDHESVSYQLKDSHKAQEAFKMIHIIIKDKWWKRAWIFQEEYTGLNRNATQLLIQSPVYNYDCECWGFFGYIQNELVISAAKFRKRTAEFCLAYKARENSAVLGKIMDRAGWYGTFNQPDSMQIPTLSTLLFEDIARRGILNKSDILAIGANCCEYESRLDTNILNKKEMSLSLSILGLYIMNGELLRYDNVSDLTTNVFEFLKQQALPIRPPVPNRSLAFTKRCRLPFVCLCFEGIHTRGVVWKLGRIIKPSEIGTRKRFAQYKQLSSGEKYGIFTSDERDVLCNLYFTIKRFNCMSLANELADCLKSEPSAREFDKCKWSSGYFVYTMAKGIASAIDRGKSLQLGCVYREHHSPYLGIFVLEDDIVQPEDCYAYTSWNYATEFEEDGLFGRELSKYVSLTVNFDERNSTVTPISWINGLCFFGKKDFEDVIFPWPSYFK